MIGDKTGRKSVFTYLACAMILLTGFWAAPAQSAPPKKTKERPVKQSEIFNPDKINRDDPVADCEKAVEENEFYREVLDILKPWTLQPANDKKSLARGIELVTSCLGELNRETEIDAYLEAAAAAHPNNWRALRAVAALYGGLEHNGVIQNGVFTRGEIGEGRVSSAERDRGRALQLYRAAVPLFEKERDGKEKIDDIRVDTFYRELAAVLMTNPVWRLQLLTDLETLPDYMDEDFIERRRNFAPADAEGNPIYYAVPESFEAAQNDGQRWRWAMERAKEGNKYGVETQLADFLRNQFGAETLRDYAFFTGKSNREQAEESERRDGVFALHTLSDDETIARLASGVKRFTLPDEQNFLKMYADVYQNGTDFQKMNAGTRLAGVYLNRRQYEKAAEIYQNLKELEKKLNRTSGNRPAEEMYRQITGNWGAFDPTTSKAAGVQTTLSWRFRNGTKADFTARKIDMPKLLADVKAYLKELEKEKAPKWDRDRLEFVNIGSRLLDDPEMKKKYLIGEPIIWSVALEPAAGHWDKRIDVPFPTETAGAYLVEGTMTDGNSDATLVRLDETALIKKQLDGETLWLAVDAVTGKPVPNAKLDFFGRMIFQPRQQAPRSAAKPYWKTKQFEAETDADGLYVQKRTPDEELNSNSGRDYEWLVTATAPGDADRFAYFGFDDFWRGRRGLGDSEQSRAYFISDRPIYRPGDKIDYKFLVASAKYDLPETYSWANRKVRLTVTDPVGTKLVDAKECTLDEAGGLTETLETAKDAKLGAYRFMLADGDDYLGEGSIRIEEYKKPEFEVTVDAPGKPVKLGDAFTAKIKANYYFGSPVQNAKVKYTVTRTQKSADWYPVRPWDWFYGNGYGWLAVDSDWFPGWKRWGRPRPYQPWFPWREHNVPEVVLEETVDIGENGTVDIKIDSSLAKEIFPGEDQEYRISAEVTDLSRRTMTGVGTVLVADEPFDVYCWTERGFYEPEAQIIARFQSFRPDRKPVAGSGAVKLFRLRYETDENGAVKPVEEEVFSSEVSFGEDGTASQSILAGPAGQYRLSCVLTDSNGNKREGASLLTVRGTAPAEESAFRSNPLELIPEKPEYVAGEKVRLAVNTGEKDATVYLFLRSENGICVSPETLRTDGPETLYEFDLSDADQPNIFVEALTVRGGRLYSEQREIPVVPEKRVLNVEVLPSKKAYKPGEAADAKIKITDQHGAPVSGEAVVTIYDRSVEQISGGTNVEPIRPFFWNWKRSSSPRVWDNLEKLSGPIFWGGKKPMRPLGSFSLTADGGSFGGTSGRMLKSAGPARSRNNGMANDEIMEMEDNAVMAVAPAMEATPAGGPADTLEVTSQSLGNSADSPAVEPAVRQNFADTALWVGKLTADQDGLADIKLTMPENLTAWTIRVWSMAPGTRVGEGTAEIITRKDLILRMERPRFLTQKDTVTLSAIVHNYLEGEKRVTVSLDVDPDAAEGAEKALTFLAENQTQNVTIPAGGETRVDWELSAKSVGDIPLVMKALTDEESDAVRESIPISIHGILKQEAFSGMIPAAARGEGKKGEAVCRVNVPAERLPEQTLLTVRFSPTLAGSMIDALPYLADYPYGCTEQTLNRFLPTVLTQKTLTDLGVNIESLGEAHANLNAQQLGDPEAHRKDRGRKGMFSDERKNPIYDPAEVRKMADAGVGRLTEMQCGDGGWGWFSGWGERSGAHLTALVTHGLLLARESGVETDESVIARGVSWLADYLAAETKKLENGETWSDEAKAEAPNQWKGSVDDNDVLVYRTLVEARRIAKPDNVAAKIMEKMKAYILRDRTKISHYALSLYGIALSEEDAAANADSIALVLRMLGQYLVVDDENQTARLDIGRAGCWNGSWRWWCWSGNDIETQAAYLTLLVRTDPKSDVAPRLVKYLLNNRRNATYWDSTRDTAKCVEAFAEYIKATGEMKQSAAVEISVDGEIRKRCEITPENLFAIDNTLEIAGTDLSDGEHTIAIQTTGDGPIYWNAYLQNFTLEDPIAKTGLEVKIERRFWLLTEDDSASATVAGGHGQPVSQRVKKYKRTPLESGAEVKSGELVEVELLIESKNDYESLLIEDRKAAGMEAVETASGYNGNGLGAYVEFRDDRVCFFVGNLRTGSSTLRYRLRAETPGRFSALPAKIEGMYAPELKGNSDEAKLGITD